MNLDIEQFRQQYLAGIDFTHTQKAFNAYLAYEINTQSHEKFVQSLTPLGSSMQLTIPIGERMSDFAEYFETDIQEMRQCWRAVEQLMSDDKSLVNYLNDERNKCVKEILSIVAERRRLARKHKAQMQRKFFDVI